LKLFAFRQLRPFAATLGLFGIAFAPVAYGYARRYSIPLGAVAAIYICFMLLLAGVLAPAFPEARGLAARLLCSTARIPLLLFLWCAPYLIYVSGTGDFRWTAILKLLAVSAAVLVIYAALPVRDLARFAPQDAAVALVLVAVVLSGQLRGIWNTPVNLDFMGRLFLICVAAWCWIFVRPVPQLGYEFRFAATVLKAAALNFVFFAVIAIPLSLVLRFTIWNPRWPGLAQFCLDYVEIFLFIALLEELFFRGFLQTLLSKRLGSWVIGQAAASLLFGFFHILHRPFPNWRYVALASLAGWFYGSAFRQGGNLMASALMHAAVDTIWRTWLTAPMRG
jgi:CAAX protease family protein